MTTKVIALSGDYGYINQITTTLKSIAYHVSEVKIYVINPDIPQEWFFNVNNFLIAIHSQVIDIKISKDTFNKEIGTNHSQVNYMTFGRLLIPDLIPEPIVLYIDCDAIVVDNIDKLFNIKLHYPIAAVQDVFFYAFNAGVLLINNQWFKKQNNIVKEMLKKGQKPGLLDADQSILNDMFSNNYYSLPLKYNYPVGYDRDVFYLPANSPNYFKLMNTCSDPKIIHYASSDKPWKQTSTCRLREKWWQYFNLEWPEIIEHSSIPIADFHYEQSVLTFTASDQLEDFDKIVRSLPRLQFIVAAWSLMSPHLMQLTQYPNVRLFPMIAGPMLDYFKQTCDGYLDINHGPKEFSIIKPFIKTNRPILSYQDTLSNISSNNQIIIHVNDAQSMIEALKKYVINKEEKS